MHDGAAAHGGGRSTARCAPDEDFSAGHPDLVEQLLQVELRVGRFATLSVFGAECVPFLVGHCVGKRERGEQDCAVGEPRDPGEQRGDRGGGGVDPGGEGEAGGRAQLPAIGGGAQQAVAAVGEVDPAALAQGLWPAVEDRAEAVERDLPMVGEVGGVVGSGGEARRIDFGDGQLVEGAGEVGRKAERFGGAFAGGADEVGEAQQAVERIDRGGERVGRVGGVERTPDAVVELGIADRDQAGEQEAATTRPDEGLGEGADGAVVGEQDSAAGKGERVAGVGSDKARSEGVGEAAVCGDGIDKRLAGLAGGQEVNPFCVNRAQARLRWRGSRAGCRRRTTAPGGPRHRGGRWRSRGPTGDWSRRVPRARLRADVWP